MLMFERMKEKMRQRQEEREQQIREEKNRLLALSEKELLVEILLELKRIEDRIDDVREAFVFITINELLFVKVCGSLLHFCYT